MRRQLIYVSLAAGLVLSAGGAAKADVSKAEQHHEAKPHEEGESSTAAHDAPSTHAVEAGHGQESHGQGGEAQHGEVHHGETAHGEADHGEADHGGGHGGGEHHNGFTLEMGFANQRLWRGFVENDTPALQPKLGFHYKGFAIYSFSNIAHTGKHAQNWTEHELELEYERHIGKWTALVGYIHYSFPDIAAAGAAAHDDTASHEPDPSSHGLVSAVLAGAGDAASPHEPAHATPRYTQEFFAGLSHRSWLNPSFRVYRDFDQRNGTYYYFSTGHPVALHENVIVRPILGLGLNQNLIIQNTAISNLDLGVSVDIRAGRHVIFSPFFQRMIGHRRLFGSHNLFGVRMLIQ